MRKTIAELENKIADLQEQLFEVSMAYKTEEEKLKEHKRTTESLVEARTKDKYTIEGLEERIKQFKTVIDDALKALDQELNLVFSSCLDAYLPEKDMTREEMFLRYLGKILKGERRISC